jgi:general nucleoside transport system ATP-binding protein
VTELAAAMVDVPASTTPTASRSSTFAHRSVALCDDRLIVHHGEIVAIAGVAGNGQTALASRLRDLHPEAGHIPEDRTRDGIIAAMPISENLALRAPRWNAASAERHAERSIGLYAIRASGARQPAGELSGGNQQKVVLARELDRKPSLIVAAEPTRGLDLESAAFIHRQLRAAAAAGAAIVLITSDLDEAFSLADGLHVIHRGVLSDRLSPEAAVTRIADLMAGVS